MISIFYVIVRMSVLNRLLLQSYKKVHATKTFSYFCSRFQK